MIRILNKSPSVVVPLAGMFYLSLDLDTPLGSGCPGAFTERRANNRQPSLLQSAVHNRSIAVI